MDTEAWITVISVSTTTLIAVIVALVGFGRWVRNWLVKQVTDPIHRLQDDVQTVDRKASRAHKRIDRILLGAK